MKKSKDKNLRRDEIEAIYGKISPFELKDKLIGYAKESMESGVHSLLDAGRGNPNWTASEPRDAFFTFGHFAVDETRFKWNDGGLAGMPMKEGIAKRFEAWVSSHPEAAGIETLKRMIDYGVTVKGFDAEAWIHELADAIIGDNYPFPDRMLRHIEKVVHDYLVKEFGLQVSEDNPIDIFAVEGATAGMCYIFDTLIANNMVAIGDRIALMTPIFTPYLEVPHLPRYNFDVVEIRATEKDDNGAAIWQYPDEEIEKLKDPSIKACFIVNPSNPPSIAMRRETVLKIKEIVDSYNPELMIISDDVYGTFVPGFRSIMADIPFNTIGVYSYSKYFGVTGWRLGTIQLHKDNVFDKRLAQLPENLQERVRRRYGALTTEPEKIPFIDRMVADSRQVALNHTAGLSTPQQVQMAFFSLYALIDQENVYKQQTMDICRRRRKLLYDGLGLPIREDHLDAAYYTQFDLLHWARQYYPDDFADYLKNNYKPIDLLLRLAEESAIVLLGGSGFHGPEWSIRISLANLSDESYSRIGRDLRRILKDYVTAWVESLKNDRLEK